MGGQKGTKREQKVKEGAMERGRTYGDKMSTLQVGMTDREQQ